MATPAKKPAHKKSAAANPGKLIHTLLSALCIDEERYRSEILPQYGVTSSKEMSEAKRAELIRDLEGKAVAAGVWKKKRNTWTPPPGKKPLAGKVTAMLLAAGRTDAYADGIALQMFKLDSWRFCDNDQLRRIVAALTYDAKRRAGRA